VGGVRRVQEEILYRVRTMQVEDDAWRRGVTLRLDQIERDLRDESLSRPEA
jgi:hypothetical protein